MRAVSGCCLSFPCVGQRSLAARRIKPWTVFGWDVCWVGELAWLRERPWKPSMPQPLLNPQRCSGLDLLRHSRKS